MKLKLSYLFIILIFLFTTCQNEKKYINYKKKSDFISTLDPHSFANINKIRLRHIFFNLEINWEKHILDGFVQILFTKNETADTLILDTKDLEIKEIFAINGSKRKWWKGKTDEIFGTPLYILLSKEDTVLKILYNTNSAEALQWAAKEQTSDKTDEFLYSQSQAILARSWFPCQDAPSVKFTYNATVKTKPGYWVLMSAENPQKLSNTGIYNFKMEQPVSSYLVALASGKLIFKPLGKNCGIYAEPSMIEKAAWEFADMQKMIDVASDLYGKYVWGRYDVLVLPPSFPFGGMENPRLTFATPTVITGDRSQVALIAHELAHSWSGNLVTNETWNDFWLNEGFTNFFEQRIMEKIYGKPYDRMRQLIAWNDLEKTINELTISGALADTKLKLDLKGRNPDDGLSDIAYEKGRFFLCHLLKVTGEKNFDDFLKKYFTKNAFKYMNTEDFLSYLNKELLNKNIRWKKEAEAQNWIYGEGLPKSAVKPVSEELIKVDKMLLSYFEGLKKPEEFDTAGFTSHHWQYLIRQFSKKANLNQVEEFEKVFSFSNRSNCEILCDWFTLSAKIAYTKNTEQTEKFLIRVGRRKMILPIYEELAKTENGKKWAKMVFDKAKTGYHSVSVQSVAVILK
ncbi:MAG: M1 family metallopeptidase [Bacteroidetes bacterium]|nr:M1 family metallopeptidase [Bacteroidota bacterium]